MARVQVAINVPDIDEAVAFYSRLFGVSPHKERAGYANFEVADPPLKLVLFEQEGPDRLNHLGVEVDATAAVAAETKRLAASGLATEVEDGVVCCHAEQDKVWVRDPGDIRWEIYTVTDDMLEASDSAAAESAILTAGSVAKRPCCS